MIFAENFKEVVSKYKVVFFDAYGVLKNSGGILPGIDKTFEYLDTQGIEYYILTNDASRSPKLLAKSYNDKGIAAITPEKIISSGMLACEYLQYKIKDGKKVVYLGTEDSAHYLETTGLQVISINDVDFNDLKDIHALVFLDDEGFSWETDINKVINLLRKQNMSVIVANTDTTYPSEKGRINIAIGSLANMVEDIIGKTFIRFGKPDAQMFMYGYELVSAKMDIRKDEILMVGDTLKTDIIGGNKFGIDTALVLTGTTQPEKAELKIASSGIIPTHICESVTDGI